MKTYKQLSSYARRVSNIFDSLRFSWLSYNFSVIGLVHLECNNSAQVEDLRHESGIWAVCIII